MMSTIHRCVHAEWDAWPTSNTITSRVNPHQPLHAATHVQRFTRLTQQLHPWLFGMRLNSYRDGVLLGSSTPSLSHKISSNSINTTQKYADVCDMACTAAHNHGTSTCQAQPSSCALCCQAGQQSQFTTSKLSIQVCLAATYQCVTCCCAAGADTTARISAPWHQLAISCAAGPLHTMHRNWHLRCECMQGASWQHPA
jgi:hypothetical protein